MPFLNIQGGYGLMGAANSGLVSCNGYERWRMHWKHSQSIDFIAARNVDNTQSVISDISIEDGNQTFLLRDFVTYGDAVRIKLPYKDSVTSSNQYIWLENHQVGSNGKLDFLQYSNTEVCRQQGAAGIYAYYQIGRDVLEGGKYQVWDTYHRDNLKIIPAEGYYDYELVADTYYMNCVAGRTVQYAMRRGASNPLSGAQDQEKILFPEEGDTVLFVTRELQPWRVVKNGQTYEDLPFLGDNLDAFIVYTRINMGSNPSTNNTKTYHSRNHEDDTLIYASSIKRNVRTTFLTGLGIEMTPVAGTGNFLVNIRWDDYDITNDCRWTGKIALKDTAILTTGNTITLAQIRTVAQTTRDAETGLFAGRTRWTCEAGSFLQLESASAIVLTENSSLVFESGSRFEQADSSLLLVGKGCTLRMLEDADIVLRGVLEVDSGGVAYLPDTVGLGSSAHIIVRPGGKLVVDGGTLTSACTGEMWQGIYVEGHSNLHQTSANQGTVVLRNGALVENARCGIRTGLTDIQDSLIININNTGGIITAENSTFHNCARAVAYFAYFDTLANGYVNDNQGSFTNCTFTVDDNNLFAANNTAFSDHVTLWAVKGVKFHGCTFNNLITNQSDRRHAVYAHSAGFVADVYCNGYEPSPSECGCPANLSDSCVFEGFSIAIEAATDGMPLAVTVKRARFANNGTAVRISANNFATVTECDFNLQSVPAGWLENTGLYLDNCTGYLVEGNSFLKTTYSQPINLSSTGIYVKNSGTAKNTLHRNGFTNLNYGVYVKNNNGNSQSGLQLSCNDFYGNNYDIYLPYKGTLKASQGNLFKGADNTFSGTRTSSIYNYGTQQLTYYYSRGSSHAPYNVSSTTVTLNSGATANDCASTLCGGLIYQPLTGLSAFTSLMFSYTPAIPSPTAAEPPTPTDGIAAAEPPANTDDASTIYNTAVRALMADSLLDLAALEQWHAAAQPIADPYSLTETRFALGYDEVFSPAASTIPSPAATEPQASTDGSAATEPLASTDEFSDYTRFHNLKRTLRDADENAINWYALTPAQIAQLQDLAENGTGRSSVMARGVLCFFYGICYDEVMAETRRAPAKDTSYAHYESFFGNHTWEYATVYYPITKHNPTLLNCLTTNRVYEKADTITYNGFVYYTSDDDLWLREDTSFGQLFVFNGDYEVLLCDMSLQPADTFMLKLSDYDDFLLMIVDSVSYIDGKKVVHLTNYTEDIEIVPDFYGQYNFSLRFMEGIGPMYGVNPYVDFYLESIACLYKDDTLYYMTHPDVGCWQYYVSIPEYSKSDLVLYPNPANNRMGLAFADGKEMEGEVFVRDVLGKVCLQTYIYQFDSYLDISCLPQGLYTLTLVDKDNRKFTRKFVKQ